MQGVEPLIPALDSIPAGTGLSFLSLRLKGHVVEGQAVLAANTEEVVVGPIEQLGIKVVSQSIDFEVSHRLCHPSDS